MEEGSSWKATMFDGSTVELTIRQHDVDAYEWYAGGTLLGGGLTHEEALRSACMSLVNQGGYRELVPASEPTRVEIGQRLASLEMAVGAALAHRAAKLALHVRLLQGSGLTFDHPVCKTLSETERRLEERLAPLADPSASTQPESIAVIEYRNHRGQTGRRRIAPQYLWHGQTGWHDEPQWLLHAFDLDRAARRDFAMAGILRWYTPTLEGSASSLTLRGLLGGQDAATPEVLAALDQLDGVVKRHTDLETALREALTQLEKVLSAHVRTPAQMAELTPWIQATRERLAL